MSTETFYLFETYVPFVFKYGFTTRNINARLSDYIGVAKPKQLIGHFKVVSGTTTEKKFKQFLQNKNIQTIPKFGNEYFSYFNNTSDLFNEFRGMKQNIDSVNEKPKQKKNQSSVTKTSSSQDDIDIIKYLNDIYNNKK